jgi:hypothetical protein
MRRLSLAILAALVACSFVSGAGAISMAINASTEKAHVGDVITLTGSITGVKTIAVYLFVTGPDLNTRGVTLENLNIPAGRGLFTTAPVNMADGSWQYVWDTSVTLGDLKPGKYTIYAVGTAVDRLRYTRGEYATVDIDFLPSETPTNEVPLPLPLSLGALVVVSGAAILTRLRSDPGK